ncbi:MAG: bifunctional metallophosphatase/5'-nucleotidase [Thiohalorhabdus sp.]
MIRLAMALLSGLALSGGQATPAAAQDSEGSSGRVTILHTNDLHGHHKPFEVGPGNATAQTGDPGKEDPFEFGRPGMVGGLAPLATAVRSIRESRGRDSVLLVDAGDSFGDDLLGNRTRGAAMIELMNALEYDFAALGDHDLDYGRERTRELDAAAAFPMRAANVTEGETGKPFLGDPTKVLEAGGIRVGLLALGYQNTPLTTSPGNVQGLELASGIATAREYVPELRERADVVVVVSHQGAEVDELLAREVPGIDLIVGGHSHDAYVRDNGTLWVQALADGAMLGEVTVEVEKGRITKMEATNHVLWTADYHPNANLAERVGDLRDPHKEDLEAVLAKALEPIGRNYRSESPFDRLVGDILIDETGADAAFLPGLGFGVTLRKGPITREALHALLPHPFTLVTLELTGEQILSVLERSATNLDPPDPLDAVGGLVQTAGMRWTVDLSRPAGGRVSGVEVAGEPLAKDERYTVATHSGMLGGLHGYDAFGQGSDFEETDRPVVEIVEEYLRDEEEIEAPEGGAITLKREREAEAEENG